MMIFAITEVGLFSFLSESRWLYSTIQLFYIKKADSSITT